MDTVCSVPQDFAAWIRADHDLAVGEQRRVTIAGREGLQIDATPTWPPRAVSKRFLAVNGSVTWSMVESPREMAIHLGLATSTGSG